ncbi:MAG: hypothetical protein ACM3RX_06730 [Methanococcaceae archaeon]
MSEEKSVNRMISIAVSCGNLERMKAACKTDDTFNDVITMLLDFYEDVHRQDWVNKTDNENQ